MEISNRNNKLNELNKFIMESRSRLECILEAVNWDEKSTLHLKKKVNSTLTKRKSDDKELFPIIEPSKNSVALNSSILEELLKKVSGFSSDVQRKEFPNNFNDLQRNFMRTEKLAIYEYCIRKTGHLSEPEISVVIDEAEGSKKEMTFAEIVAQKRDLKRRSLKYRTTKEPPLSHSEEIKNLIELQMRALSQYLNPAIDKLKNTASRVSVTKKPDDLLKHSCEETSTSRNRSPDRKSRRRRSRSKYLEYVKKGQTRDRSRSISRGRKRSSY